MFLHSLRSSDKRFKSVRLKEGLNLIVSEKGEDSSQGDSRNSTGKSSFVWLLRYLLGGKVPNEVSTVTLEEDSFTGLFSFPSEGGESELRVTRSLGSTTKLLVENGPSGEGWSEEHIDDWRAFVSERVFRIPKDLARPTTGQMWGQFIRSSFKTPTKGHPSDSAWETGIKLGYLFGLSPEILNKAAVVSKLETQKKAVNQTIKSQALPNVTDDEAGIRSDLANVRASRSHLAEQLEQFTVDEQYAEHQISANGISRQIRDLNEETLLLERRRGDLQETLVASPEVSEASFSEELARVFQELGVVLPDSVEKRYEEVASFHASVIANRRSFLEDAIAQVDSRLRGLEETRSQLDRERSQIMRLLAESVALDTFLEAQKDLADLDSEIADLERQLENAKALGQIRTDLAVARADAESSVRAEFDREEERLNRTMELFGTLGSEIYDVRNASLRISVTNKGVLKVEPHISGDAGGGVKNVETFVLDMVCMISGLETGRAPKLLVHDSHLFDGVDSRQVASCLNIGARLADEHGFQYVVTMNSDVLSSAEDEEAFDRKPYVVDLPLTDSGEDGGIFGYQFD